MTLEHVTAKHSGKTEADRLREAEELLSKYANGVPVSQLVAETGLSKPTVHRRINAAIKARIAVTVDAYRESVNAVYDEQMVNANRHITAALQWFENATLTGDQTGVEKALNHHLRGMEMLIRITEHRRKLNGLDAPVKAEVTVNVQDETDRAIKDLHERMERLRASAST